MDKRKLHRLTVVEPTTLDTFAGSKDNPGYSPENDLLCGNCGELLFSDYTKEEAQHVFVSKTGRTLTKCPSCLKDNLLSTQTQKS